MWSQNIFPWWRGSCHFYAVMNLVIKNHRRKSYKRPSIWKKKLLTEYVKARLPAKVFGQNSRQWHSQDSPGVGTFKTNTSILFIYSSGEYQLRQNPLLLDVACTF